MVVVVVISEVTGNPSHDLGGQADGDAASHKFLLGHSKQAASIDHLALEDLLDSLGEHHLVGSQVGNQTLGSQLFKLSVGHHIGPSRLWSLYFNEVESARENGKKENQPRFFPFHRL